MEFSSSFIESEIVLVIFLTNFNAEEVTFLESQGQIKVDLKLPFRPFKMLTLEEANSHLRSLTARDYHVGQAKCRHSGRVSAGFILPFILPKALLRGVKSSGTFEASPATS